MHETEIDLKSIRPMRGRVLVEVIKETETTGGILLLNDATEGVKRHAHKARVLAVGANDIDDQGRVVHQPDVVPGEMVWTRNMGPAMRGKCRPSCNPQNPDAEAVLSIPGDWILALA